MSSDLNSGQRTYDRHLVNANSWYFDTITIATFAIVAAVITINRITLTVPRTARRS